MRPKAHTAAGNVYAVVQVLLQVLCACLIATSLGSFLLLSKHIMSPLTMQLTEVVTYICATYFTSLLACNLHAFLGEEKRRRAV